MNQPRLTLSDLVDGLERFGARYNAIDVFADDVSELQPGPGVGDVQLPSNVRPIGVGKNVFEVRLDEKIYFLRVFKDAGVVRLSREPEVVPSSSTSSGAVFGALAGAAIGSATSKKGEGVVGGLMLGLLIGAALGSANEAQPVPHKVFTLRFDPGLREWKTYSGGLVRWMKSELASSPSAASALAD